MVTYCHSFCRYSVRIPILVQMKEAEDDVLKDLQAQQLELEQRNMKDRLGLGLGL